MTTSQKTLLELYPYDGQHGGVVVGVAGASSHPNLKPLSVSPPCSISMTPATPSSSEIYSRGGVSGELRQLVISPAPRLVQTTSRDAYTRAWINGVVGEQERQYLDLLRTAFYGLTDAEAAEQMNLPCSTVSARRNGINQKHAKTAGKYLILNYDGERRQNRSGNTALVWRLDKERWG